MYLFISLGGLFGGIACVYDNGVACSEIFAEQKDHSYSLTSQVLSGMHVSVLLPYTV